MGLGMTRQARPLIRTSDAVRDASTAGLKLPEEAEGWGRGMAPRGLGIRHEDGYRQTKETRHPASPRSFARQLDHGGVSPLGPLAGGGKAGLFMPGPL